MRTCPLKGMDNDLSIGAWTVFNRNFTEFSNSVVGLRLWCGWGRLIDKAYEENFESAGSGTI